MRTTVDLPPAVHRRASALARQRHQSLSTVLADLTAEREREEQILRAKQRVFESVFHPLRGFRQRHGLKYHEV